MALGWGKENVTWKGYCELGEGRVIEIGSLMLGSKLDGMVTLEGKWENHETWHRVVGGEVAGLWEGGRSSLKYCMA